MHITPLNQIAGAFNRLRVGSRQVLHLNQTSGPPACTVGSVKLEQATDAVVIAHARLYRVVLFCGGFSQLLPDLQHTLYVLRIAVLCHQIGHCGLCKTADGLPVIQLHRAVKPLCELFNAVGIAEPSQHHGLLREAFTALFVQLQRAEYEIHVNGHAATSDLQIDLPLML